MKTAHKVQSDDSDTLRNGDRMSRREFHFAYSRMPGNYRAELIGGVVFEPSPVSYSHAEYHSELNFLLKTYSVKTPGTGVVDNATVMLSEEDEVQPDVTLRLLNGRSRVTKTDYIEGAPELVAEIAHSSRALDLHMKKDRYALAGVQEYIVLCVKPKKLFWFDLRASNEVEPDNDETLRSIVYPGLWIRRDAILSGDCALMLEVLERGLESSEHKRFLEQLEASF